MALKKKILFTGGGSAGHVTLNLALIPLFHADGWEISYIGSKSGIEKELISKLDYVRYYGIHTGKLRRYFSLKNVTDMIKIPLGILQAFFIVRRENPNLIFSKGGFVSFPVVLAGRLNGKKSIIHESDVTPGLANKLSLPFVSKFFTTFDETKQYVKNKYTCKVAYVGPVISDRLKNGKVDEGRKLMGFDAKKPVVFFMGGSLGAKSINEAVRKNLKTLLKKYQIIHQCGKGQLAENLVDKDYKQFEYLNEELPDVMALADVVVSRAGSNSIFELLSLEKPMLLVPLPSTSSRGEQSLNAQTFKDKGYAEIVKDEDLKNDKFFISQIEKVYKNKAKYITNIKTHQMKMTDIKSLFLEVKNFAD